MARRISREEHLFDDRVKYLTRRELLQRCMTGMGALALGGLFQNSATARQAPHFAPRAKNVIFLNMSGAPSQIDLFDYKPKLKELAGAPIPASALEGLRFPFIKEATSVLPGLYPFRQYGQDGTWISDQLPYTSKIADEITVIRSMQTNEVNHVPAELLFNSGSPRMGRPCIGSWVAYGLGSENQDLPGFVVLSSGKPNRCGTSCFSNGFLPSEYQGVQFRSAGDPVLYVNNPPGMDSDTRRDILDATNALNDIALADVGDPEIAARIAAFELAFRMQASVPGLMDIADEPAHIHELYGTAPGQTSFSNNCLLARRLVERGVRFVQVHHGGWDHHGGGDQNIVTNLPERCKETDQGGAALVMDLKQRGLLDDTLVIWASEFGRTPMLQGSYNEKDMGRDHLPSAFTIWMAGGGIKAGFNYGASDELGMRAVEGAVHVHDLQATLLHCCGIDHTRLTYRFQGRDFRLTDVHGHVVQDILA